MKTTASKTEPGYTMGSLFGYRFLLPKDLCDDLANKVAEDEKTEDAEDAAEQAEALAEIAAHEFQSAEFEIRELLPSFAVFDSIECRKNWQRLNEGEAEKNRLNMLCLEAAQADFGRRNLIATPLAQVASALDDLAEDMPNFLDVIEILKGELAIAMTGKPENFHVTPIAMDGVPGIGKTRFAREVANILNVGFDAISMGAATGNFELAGVSPGWGNTRPGRLSRLLAEGKTGCPVVLLDELDKIGSDPRFPVLPVLLDLLEPDSAKHFRDEGLEVRLDASKLIILATSNNADCIPEALQSRMRMIEIQQPTAEQRRQILDRITQDFEPLGVSFKPEIIAALAEIDMDLRALRRFLRDGAGKALLSGNATVDTAVLPGKTKQSMGFI